MSVAQELYEGGFITYMRTDSVTLSSQAIQAARSQIAQLYGNSFLPPSPRIYNSKVKNAQEAHEAIRPAGEAFATPGADRADRGDRFRLYELIWKRTLASQMADAKGETMTVRIEARAAQPFTRAAIGPAFPETAEACEFVASGRTITFPGFLKAYQAGGVTEGGDAEETQARLPQLTQGAGTAPGGGDRLRPRDPAAGALHRTDPGRQARGTGDRPPVDLRVDHPHHHLPGLRVQEGGPRWSRPGWLSRSPGCWRRTSPPPGRLQVHRRDGGRPRRGRQGRHEPAERAQGVLVRRP